MLSDATLQICLQCVGDQKALNRHQAKILANTLEELELELESRRVTVVEPAIGQNPPLGLEDLSV